MARRPYRFSATYEFDGDKPETTKGEVEAPSHESAAKLAIRALRKAHPKRQPSSLVVVLEF